MNKNLRIEGSRVFMCCGKSGCPSVEINKEGLVEIKDDFGNKVVMKKAEAELLPAAVKRLNEKR